MQPTPDFSPGPQHEPFDWFAYHHTMRDIEAYLAELKYIDDARKYIDERTESAAAGPGPHTGAIEITLGETFPFTRTLRSVAAAQSHYEQHVHAELATHAEQARQWAAAEITAIEDRVRFIRDVPDSPFDDIGDALQRVHFELNHYVDNDVGALDDDLADWKGPAAEEFAKKFYNKFGEVKENQQTLVQALLGTVAASRIITRSGQHSIMSAAAATRDVLREQLELRSLGNDDVVSKKTVLMIAGVGTSVLAAAAMPALWSVSLATVSGALTMASSHIPEELTEDDKNVQGTSADEIAANFFDRNSEIIANTSHQFDQLRDNLQEVRVDVEDLHQNGEIVPARPSVVEDPRSSEFHHQSADRH